MNTVFILIIIELLLLIQFGAVRYKVTRLEMNRRRALGKWSRSSLILLSFWFCAASATVDETCPQGCVCENVGSEGDGVVGFRTSCSDLWLERLPAGIPRNTTHLCV